MQRSADGPKNRRKEHLKMAREALERWRLKTYLDKYSKSCFPEVGIMPDQVLTSLASNRVNTVEEMKALSWMLARRHGEEVLNVLRRIDQHVREQKEQEKEANAAQRRQDTVKRKAARDLAAAATPKPRGRPPRSTHRPPLAAASANTIVGAASKFVSVLIYFVSATFAAFDSRSRAPVRTFRCVTCAKLGHHTTSRFAYAAYIPSNRFSVFVGPVHACATCTVAFHARKSIPACVAHTILHTTINIPNSLRAAATIHVTTPTISLQSPAGSYPNARGLQFAVVPAAEWGLSVHTAVKHLSLEPRIQHGIKSDAFVRASSSI